MENRIIVHGHGIYCQRRAVRLIRESPIVVEKSVGKQFGISKNIVYFYDFIVVLRLFYNRSPPLQKNGERQEIAVIVCVLHFAERSRVSARSFGCLSVKEKRRVQSRAGNFNSV